MDEVTKFDSQALKQPKDLGVLNKEVNIDDSTVFDSTVKSIERISEASVEGFISKEENFLMYQAYLLEQYNDKYKDEGKIKQTEYKDFILNRADLRFTDKVVLPFLRQYSYNQ